MVPASAVARAPRSCADGRRRPWPVLAGALLALMALTSCSAIQTQVDLTSRLRRAGFSNVKVHTNETNGFTTVTVDGSRANSGIGTDAQDNAAKVVWTTFPRRVDAIEANIDGHTKLYSRSNLQGQFGSRPASYDKKTVGDDLKSLGVGVIIALIIGGLLCVGLIVLIVVLVRKGRRKRRDAQGYPGGPGYPGGGPGYPGPPPGYPQPGYPQPGYQPGYPQPGYQQPGYPPPGGGFSPPPSGDASNYPPPPP